MRAANFQPLARGSVSPAGRRLGEKWVIVTDLDGEPVFVLDSHYFLRDALFNQLESNPGTYWHRPIIVRDIKTRLGDVIGRMTVAPERPGDDVIHHDIILVWGAQRRIITGSDLLGRLLRDIATVVATSPPSNAATPAAIQSGLAVPTGEA